MTCEPTKVQIDVETAKQRRETHSTMPICSLKLLFIVILQVGLMASVRAQPDYAAVSNCFWVVAPIHELSREMQLRELWGFTQGRVGWFTGFFGANKGNKDFEAAFTVDLERKKAAGLAMKEDLRQAITRKDASKYQQIVSRAVACDKVIGIRTEFIPRMGM